jgi:NADH-quinone oxidoreductase subunit M
VATVGLVLASVYSLIMLQRACFGQGKSNSELLGMRPRELGMMLVLASLLILLGLYPQPVIDTASGTVGAVQHWLVSIPSVSEGVL